MISNRTLCKWRKEALTVKNAAESNDPKAGPADVVTTRFGTIHLCDKILQLTQELMDINLMRGEKK